MKAIAHAVNDSLRVSVIPAGSKFMIKAVHIVIETYKDLENLRLERLKNGLKPQVFFFYDLK